MVSFSKIVVGTPVTLQDTERKTLNGRIWGSIPNKCLIIGLKGKVSLPQKEELVLRTVLAGEAVGFTGFVLQCLPFNDYTIFYLSLPQEVARVNLRKYKRFSIFLPVRANLKREEKAPKEHFVLLDMSLGGARGATQRLNDIPSSLSLDMTLPGSSTSIHGLQAKVVRVQKTGKDDVYEIGMAFKALPVNVNSLKILKLWTSTYRAFFLN